MEEAAGVAGPNDGQMLCKQQQRLAPFKLPVQF